jgi:hypothetical protein
MQHLRINTDDEEVKEVAKKAKHPNLTITPKAMRKAQKHMKVNRHV